jgi:hypothetical protein
MAFIVEEKNEVATFIIAIQVLLMRSKTKYIYTYISSLWKKTTCIINELQDKNIYLHYRRRRQHVEFVVQEKMKV